MKKENLTKFISIIFAIISYLTLIFTCNLESYAIVKRNNDTNYNMDIEYSACLKCSGYESPTCSNSISGIKRLKAAADCEVK